MTKRIHNIFASYGIVALALSVSGYEHKISQYANDTTLVIKNCKNNLNRVLDTLKLFHSISGLKVNIEKTKVVQLGQVGGSRMINLEK